MQDRTLEQIPTTAQYKTNAPALSDTHREEIEAAFDAAADDLSPAELLGNCPTNAVRLYDELKSLTQHRRIIRGGLDLPDEPTPLSIDGLAEYGVAHWWVEARIDGVWFTFDIASEVPDALGYRLITETRPEAYLPFEINPDNHEMFRQPSSRFSTDEQPI